MRLRNFVAVTLLISAAAFAQTPNGRIIGRLLDSAGASIPGGAVTATNTATNVKTATTTNSEGNYQIPNLIPGVYRLEADAPGFKRYVRDNLEMQVADVLDIEIKMEIGAVTESVTVTAETPLLESATGSIGKVIDNQRILDLPVPSGAVFYLTQLTPGIANTASPTNLYGPNEMGPPAGIAVSGTRANSTEFAIDGNPIMSNGGLTFNPPPEMVQEFRVRTAAYDSSVGRFSGAHVNLVMKSGANAVHGALVYSNLSRGMMSHDFFTNRFIWDPRTGPITSDKIDKAWPPQRIVQFRGVISGPVYIPKLYDGRNRTFFMFGAQDYQRAGSTRAFYTVPTEKQRAGDFSDLLALGARYQIYDPATIEAIGNGRYSRQPLAGNIVPASRIAAMSKKLLNFYPLPNTVGTVDGINNYTDPDANGNEYRSYSGRVDHVVTDNNRLQGSFTVLEQRDYSLQSFHNEAKGNRLYRTQRGVALTDVMTLRPTLLVEFRYGVTRFGQFNYPFSLGYDLAQLGFVQSLVSSLDRTYTTLPETTISGFTTIGNNSGTNVQTTYHAASVQATNIRGNHSLRFGAELRVLQESRYTWGNISPAFSFTTAYTQGPVDNSPAAPIGQGMAAFLFGVLSSGGIDRNAAASEQSKYTGFYVQDDWKLSRRLTLNLGLRYEIDFPLTERYNRTISGFDYTQVLPFDAAARANYAKSPIAEVPVTSFRSVGALIYPGLNGAPRHVWNTDKNNFAPRIGLAYLVRPKTVIRAGYGFFYEPSGSDRTNLIQSAYSRRTPLTATIDNGQRFIADMANPFPNGVLDPEGSAMGYRQGLGTSISYFNPNLHSAYNQRWSLTLQQQLPHRFLAEFGYTGNRSVGIPLTQAYNGVPAQYLSTLNVRDQARINQLGQAVPNPFYQLPGWEGASMQGTTVGRSQLLRAYPQFTGVSTTDNGGFSWYHGALLRIEKRLSRGFTIDATYTRSKLMEAIAKLNETDLRPTRVISTLDRPNISPVSGIYQLPFGRGKKWLRTNRWLDHPFGGWSLQAIYQAQSGQPIDFGNVFFYGDTSSIALSSAARSVERWFNVDAGFERDSTKQPASNIRTFPLRFNGVRSDGINNWNVSAIKNFRLREKWSLQFRAEAVDATNAAVFAVPNATPSSTAFGQVSGMRNNGTQRRITFAGKLSW